MLILGALPTFLCKNRSEVGLGVVSVRVSADIAVVAVIDVNPAPPIGMVGVPVIVIRPVVVAVGRWRRMIRPSIEIGPGLKPGPAPIIVGRVVRVIGMSAGGTDDDGRAAIGYHRDDRDDRRYAAVSPP